MTEQVAVYQKIRRLEQRAAKAAAKAEAAKKAMQNRCKHPLVHLELRYSGVSTHHVGGDVEHGMCVECCACGVTRGAQLVIHADVW